MRVYGRIGLVMGLFFLFDGLVYGYTNKEFQAFPLLLMTAGGFMLLAVSALRAFRRASRQETPGEEGAGEPHVGPTVWPLVLALSGIGFTLGVLAARWLLAVGAALFVVAAAGWFSDIRRQWSHGGHEPSTVEHAGRG